jgi:hypothetical protein
MKFFKTLGIYKACNVRFHPTQIQAYSYDWWCFVAVINGLVVFNRYKYSVSTARHHDKVLSLMAKLGIKIDVTVNTRLGLTHSYAITDAVKTSQAEIAALQAKIDSSRSRESANVRRRAEITRLTDELTALYPILVVNRLTA